MVLLHVLHDLASEQALTLTVAHLDHGIRGAESRADARFVKVVARRLKLPCVCGRACVPDLADKDGLSLEMAARKARYAFLAKVARQVKADAIATAHTADDQAETLLLKLIRGAGRTGLSGIDADTWIDGVRVVRPLLAVTRRDIETFLKERGVEWRDDATNRDPRFLRNRVRHELLPLLARHYNPGIREALLRTADVLAAEDEWMDELAVEALDACLKGEALDGARLAAHPLAARRRIIRSWLIRQGAPRACQDFDVVRRIGQLVGKRRGSEVLDLPEGWVIERSYVVLTCRAGAGGDRPVAERVRVTVPGVTEIPSLGIRVTVRLAPGIAKKRGQRAGLLPASATVDARVLGRQRLEIRGVRAGDRMAPYGMQGTRKLQDILVDAKVPRHKRKTTPVLVCGDRVVWLPGYRIDRAWAVTDEAARNVQVEVAEDSP